MQGGKFRLETNMFSGQINTLTVDLQQLKKLSNINDINRLLHETLAKERNIDVELEKLLAKRNVIEGSLANLQGATSEV
jgi:conserved oligomeric Golgi complex subunit 4